MSWQNFVLTLTLRYRIKRARLCHVGLATGARACRQDGAEAAYPRRLAHSSRDIAAGGRMDRARERRR